MKPSHRFYKVCFYLSRAILGALFWFDVKGRENIPDGAAMVCSNHSNLIDPLFIAYAFGVGHFLHFIAKIELFRVPVLSAVIKKLGAIRVDRDISDLATIKTSLNYLKNGEKVAIFPEGTRTVETDYASIKNGAIKMAERAGVPIVPVFVPRKKLIFRRMPIVIGEPYTIEKQDAKRTPDDYLRLAENLMRRIEALTPVPGSAPLRKPKANSRAH